MSEYTTVARPYAKAAFDFAVEQGAIEKWHEMLSFASEVEQNDEIQVFLKSALNRNHALEVFISVCGEQLDEKGQNLVKIMASNDRIHALPEVARLFGELRADYDKAVTVDVTSAVKLTKAHEKSLMQALEKRLERKVKLNCSVDSSTVGGLLIKAGDLVIDSTLRSKLSRLANTLQS